MHRSYPLRVEPLETRAVPGSVLAGLPTGELFDLGLDAFLMGHLGTATEHAPPRASFESPVLLPANAPAPRPLEAAYAIPWGITPPPSTTSGPSPHDVLFVAGSIVPKPGTQGILTPGATYFFNDHLFPEQEEAPWLIPMDPLGLNRFETAEVYGQERQVYRLDGNASPRRENAGLLVGTQGVLTPDNYSIEFIFESVERAGSWRKLLDTRDRQSDNQLYLSPSNVLSIYPDGYGVQEIALNTFYHVVITNETGAVRMYVNGQLDLALANTTTMHISNPLGLLYLFTDDEFSTGEYGDTRVALLRLYDGALTADAVAALASDPFVYP